MKQLAQARHIKPPLVKHSSTLNRNNEGLNKEMKAPPAAKINLSSRQIVYYFDHLLALRYISTITIALNQVSSFSFGLHSYIESYTTCQMLTPHQPPLCSGSTLSLAPAQSRELHPKKSYSGQVLCARPQGLRSCTPRLRE